MARRSLPASQMSSLSFLTLLCGDWQEETFSFLITLCSRTLCCRSLQISCVRQETLRLTDTHRPSVCPFLRGRIYMGTAPWGRSILRLAESAPTSGIHE